MKPEARDAATFRAWLIEKVKRSRWVTYKDDDLARLANRLGVQESVLVEAQRQLSASRKEQGLKDVTLGSRHARDATRTLVTLDMPESVHQDWVAYCSLRDLEQAVVLRSLVHTMLSGPENPTWIGRGWVYRGTRRLLSGYDKITETGRGWPWGASTSVTHGVVRALTVRADRCNSSKTALIRGAVIDLLEGRTTRLLMMTSPSGMWEDENKYWLGGEPGA